MPTGFNWPFVTFMYGKMTYPGKKKFKCYWGECSHGERWQFRINVRSYYWCVVFRKKS